MIRRLRLNPVTAWVIGGFVGVLVLGVAVLVLAGARDERSTAFSLNVGAVARVATLAPGHTACQGPIAVDQPIRGLTAWLARDTGPGVALTATLRGGQPGGSPAVARLIPSSQPVGDLPSVGGSLDRTISGGAVTLCLRSSGSAPAVLLGGPATSASGALTRAGGAGGAGGPHIAAAVLFEKPHPASLLSLVPTIFSRAALFHPAWLGAWTFWLLLVALVGAAAAILASLIRAAAIDGEA